MCKNPLLQRLNPVGLALAWLLAVTAPSASAGYLQAQAGGSAAANANGGPMHPAVIRDMETFQSGVLPAAWQIVRQDFAEAEVQDTRGSAKYRIRAQVGSLSVRVDSFAMGARNNERPDVPTIATGETYAWAEWADEIIVSGTPGVPVLLKFTVYLTSSANFTGTLGTGNRINFRYRLPGLPQINVAEDDVSGGVNILDQRAFELMPGQYDIGSYISVSAHATARFNDVRYPTMADAFVDAGDTALYYIDVLSDQGSYSTVSGVDLTTPIPEPQTWLMLAAGLALLARRHVGAAHHEAQR